MAELYRSDIVNVDINKSLNRMYVGGVLATGDNKANRFGANVYRGGDPVSLDACGVTGYFIRPNMETVVVRGVAEGHTAYVDLEQACYACEGQFSLAIKVSSDGVVHTVRIVDGYIRQTQTDVMIDPGTAVPSLDDLFAQIAAMEAVTAEANETIATIKTDTATAIDAANKATADTIKATVELSETTAPAIIETATGDIVSITDGADRPAVQLVSHIDPVQEGEGDPSPDNVRPISGWDSVTARRNGKNLYIGRNVGNTTNNGITATMNGGSSFILSGTSVENSSGRTSENIFLKAGTYTCSVYGLNVHNTSMDRLFVSGLNYDRIYVNNIQTGAPKSFTLAQDTTLLIDVVFDANSTYNNAEIKIQLEYGEVATAYEPCQGQTLTADLPETVYGGTVDWGTGVLTVEKVIVTLDGTEEVITSGDNVIYKVQHKPLIGFNAISTHYPANRVYCGEDVNIINALEGTGFDTWSSFAAAQAAAGTPVQIVYPLATPYTIQLTPQQLETLKGTNNVWSDCGNTDLTYIADTKLYIDRKIAAIAAATV